MSKPSPSPEHGLDLPETVVVCGLCRGHGQYRQRYCDAPAMTGPCDGCGGAQFRYRESMRPVPETVRQQIANRNGLVPDRDVTCYAVLVNLRSAILVRPGTKGRYGTEMTKLGCAFGPRPFLED